MNFVVEVAPTFEFAGRNPLTIHRMSQIGALLATVPFVAPVDSDRIQTNNFFSTIESDSTTVTGSGVSTIHYDLNSRLANELVLLGERLYKSQIELSVRAKRILYGRLRDLYVK
jgi:hypothetical protein